MIKAVMDFKNVLQEMKKDIFSYLFLFIQFIYFSGLVRQFGTDQFLVANILFTAALCVFKKKLTSRDVVIIIISLGAFALINIVPILMWGADLRLLLGFTGRIILGILIVVYLKDKFYERFEKLVYVLAFMSLLLFAVQLINVQVFDIFRGFSELVLTDRRLYFGRDELTGHRYLLVFLVNSWGEFRNSGFMWEPAAFGAMLVWAGVFNLFEYKSKLNPRLYIFLLAAITTFSRGTYIYIVLFVIVFLLANINARKVVITIAMIAILIITLYQIDFFKDGINDMIEKNLSEAEGLERISSGQVRERETRVGSFVANIGYILEQPFGFGLRADVFVVNPYLTSGPNGIVTLLRNWGIFSFFILFVSAYKVITKLQFNKRVQLSPLLKLLLILLILLPISGNPFYNQPMLLALLFSGYIIRLNNHEQSQNINSMSEVI